MSEPRRGTREDERRIGRLLVIVTYVAVAFLSIGVGLMALRGIGPLDGGPPLDPGTVGGALTGLQPAGFLWLGLLAVVATPISRVVVAALGYARSGDRGMVAISLAILAVIAVGIGAGLAGGA